MYFYMDTVGVPYLVLQDMKAHLVFPQGSQIVDITTKFDYYLGISTRTRLEANPK